MRFETRQDSCTYGETAHALCSISLNYGTA